MLLQMPILENQDLIYLRKVNENYGTKDFSSYSPVSSFEEKKQFLIYNYLNLKLKNCLGSIVLLLLMTSL